MKILSCQKYSLINISEIYNKKNLIKLDDKSDCKTEANFYLLSSKSNRLSRILKLCIKT